MALKLPNQAVMVIAEVGVNHNGDEGLARDLIVAAKQAGADVVKFQTFRADDLAISTAKTADYQARQVGAESQREMLRRLELPLDAFVRLKKFCETQEIAFLSSPFDESSVDALEKMEVFAFKVGSGEITNFPLLQRIARTKKPLLMSTGMADLSEIRDAVEWAQKHGVQDLVLFHCVSDYPTALKDLNLKFLHILKNEFQQPIGLSDHSLSTVVPAAAVALGAGWIEKHLTLDRNMSGPDHQASLDPKSFAEMVKAIRETELALGSERKVLTPSEMKTKHIVRKSIVARKPLAKGTRLELSHLAFKRPGDGLSPAQFEKVLGKKLNCDVSLDEKIDLTKVE